MAQASSHNSTPAPSTGREFLPRYGDNRSDGWHYQLRQSFCCSRCTFHPKFRELERPPIGLRSGARNIRSIRRALPFHRKS
jgi:hypothetical protein